YISCSPDRPISNAFWSCIWPSLPHLPWSTRSIYIPFPDSCSSKVRNHELVVKPKDILWRLTHGLVIAPVLLAFQCNCTSYQISMTGKQPEAVVCRLDLWILIHV